jgi:hypothetical protein
VSELPEPPYSLLCSACRTPCSGADAHVIPRWNPEQRRVITAYRCGNCWPAGLEELRTALRSPDPDVALSFVDFIERRGFGKDATMLRAVPAEARLGFLLSMINLLEQQRFTFEP